MRTQYDRIEKFLRARGYASYCDIQKHCSTAYPWKRISEMQGRGWSFSKRSKEHNGRQITLISLIGCP